MIERYVMCHEPYSWIFFPLVFLGIMILFAIFSRRRGGWFCCSPFDRRLNYLDRIRELENEIEKLKGR